MASTAHVEMVSTESCVKWKRMSASVNRVSTEESAKTWTMPTSVSVSLVMQESTVR